MHGTFRYETTNKGGTPAPREMAGLANLALVQCASLLLPNAPLARPAVRAPVVRLCSEPPEGGWAEYEWWEAGQTCVEYKHESTGELRLGVYEAYTMVEDAPHIRPLCAAAEEDGISCLFCDEDEKAVPLSAVSKVLDPDYVFISERQAGGGQGLGNPHGEHGETVYDLRDVEISEDVTLVLRENRDTERVL